MPVPYINFQSPQTRTSSTPLAQVPRISPGMFDYQGEINKSANTAIGLSQYLQKSKEWNRQQKMQDELSKANERYQQGIKTGPAMPPGIGAGESGFGIRPPGETPTTDYQSMIGAGESGFGLPGPATVEPAMGLQSVADKTQNQEALEAAKSYPFQMRAQYLREAEGIYRKYGEEEKARSIEKDFHDNLGVISKFSPKTAAKMVSDRYGIDINAQDIKRLNAGKPSMTRDGKFVLWQNETTGDWKLEKNPLYEKERKESMGWAIDEKSDWHRVDLNEKLPPGWTSQEQYKQERIDTKQTEQDEWNKLKEAGIEKRHGETLAEAKKRHQENLDFQKKKFEEQKKTAKDKETKKGEKEVILDSGKRTDEPEPRTIWRVKDTTDEFTIDDEGNRVPWEKGKARPKTEKPTTKKTLAGVLGGPASGQPVVPGTAAAGTPSKGKLTDPNIAKQYLNKARGDKNKARELAKKDGWEF